MSASSAIALAFVSQQVVTYVGFFLFIAGIIGGPLVLIVFLSLRTFRQSSCAFYLTVMSIVNTVHLFTGLLTFIMINGFGINWTNMSIFYCKFRQFYVQFCIGMSLTCMCLATIDQFLATCSNPRWHRWNNIKTARYILTGASIVWISHGIPFIIYYNRTVASITIASSCVITNVVFQNYINFFEGPVLLSTLPIAIMILFGILAYRNVQQITHRAVPLVRRELDKQLTTMVLVQVFYDLIAIIPIGIENICFLIIKFPTDSFTVIELNLIKTIIILWYYFYFVSPFYIYMCVSKRFRQQLVHVLFTVYFNRWQRPRIINNQIDVQS